VEEMRDLQRRITKLEDRFTKGNDILTYPLTFTEEQVHVYKTLCLTFKKHFGAYVRNTWNEEPKTDSLQDAGHTWCRHVTSIIVQLLIHKDLMDKVRDVPELSPLVRLTEMKNVD
jgi:hypothetical protein